MDFFDKIHDCLPYIHIRSSLTNSKTINIHISQQDDADARDETSANQEFDSWELPVDSHRSTLTSDRSSMSRPADLSDRCDLSTSGLTWATMLHARYSSASQPSSPAARTSRNISSFPPQLQPHKITSFISHNTVSLNDASFCLACYWQGGATWQDIEMNFKSQVHDTTQTCYYYYRW